MTCPEQTPQKNRAGRSDAVIQDGSRRDETAAGPHPGSSPRFPNAFTRVTLFELFRKPCLAFLPLALACGTAFCIQAGEAAPEFSVQSGDGKTLSLDGLKGRAILIIYETKGAVEQNRQLKSALPDFIDLNSDKKTSLAVVPVINCSSAFWATRKIWKNKLSEDSKKENITVYGDWDGKMASAYSMVTDSSNLVMIGKSGKIIYASSGPLPQAAVAAFLTLLKQNL
ncbi:MAG: redoxin domain-containing protein [Elusimicrobia bacterium]|nr:redoxin domain-containing protein [Elusimicrobiota bacterium]